MFSDVLTVGVFKKYYENIIRKINRIATKSNVNMEAAEGNENSILPDMPIDSVERLEGFEKLLRESAAARKEYVSIIFPKST